MIVLIRRWLAARIEPDPFGINAALADRKARRLAGYARPYRRARG